LTNLHFYRIIATTNRTLKGVNQKEAEQNESNLWLNESAGFSKTNSSGHDGVCIAGMYRRFSTLGFEAAKPLERAVHCY
jgi:hypothetical protein